MTTGISGEGRLIGGWVPLVYGGQRIIVLAAMLPLVP